EGAGPATAALYEQKAARKAVVDEAAAKLRALSEPPAAEAQPFARAPGRRRNEADPQGGDAA
ncbi:MAG: hypothetical protein ACK4TJ_06630, partial [Tabrizicola sp.]